MTRPNGNRAPLSVRRTATVITSASQTWNLNADETVNITVQSPFPQQYEIGDKITVFGRDYTLNRLPQVKKTGMQEFVYTLVFEGVQYDLIRAQYELSVETSGNTLQDVQGDSLTGTLHKFMEVLVANANRVFPGKWSLGTCPETDYKTLTFDGENCLAVLQNLCTQFTEGSTTVEFEIVKSNDVYVINLKKVGSTLPYTFKFGRGGGMYELTRQNVTSTDIVTKLYVYGSTENISLKYRADRLCLPGKTKHQSFIKDDTLIAKYGIIEGRKVFDKIKPHYDGEVTSVVSGNVLQFIDTAFPFDLMAKQGDETIYLVSGETAKIHFNTGNLAGYEFEVVNYDHSTHKFTIKTFQDDRGDVFPNSSSEAFQIHGRNGSVPGDKYKILGIIYPDSITNAAESELEDESEAYYPQVSQPKVQYALNLEKNFLKKLVGGDVSNAIVNAFVPGDYLHIVDDDIDVDKSIRIKGFTRDIIDEYKYTLTISDTVTTSTQTRVLQELTEIDKFLSINNLKDPVRARQNWRTSREVLDMVFDAEGDYYTDKIKPLSIDTSMLSVGAKSMQFGLVNTVIQPNYQGNKNVVSWKGGVLTHYTINEDSAVSWVIADGSITLTDDNARYLYAKCSRTGTSGTFLWSTQQIKVEDDANYYHFLIGTLSSVDTDLNVRSMSLTYGFTTINGRFIKTGMIQSADGNTYFDLDNGEIGGRIVFMQNGSEKTLAELGAESSETKDFINNTLPGILDDIQAQLDGQIEQFFYDYDPDDTSEPTATWIATDTAAGNNNEKEAHLGDLFYNTDTGKVFRYVKVQVLVPPPMPGGVPGRRLVYKWQELSDAEVAEALSIANDALDLAMTKRRIFTSTPYPPYEVGDLWVQGGNGDIMRCKTARSSGNYSSSDWEKASKYTDDTALTTFINGAYTSAITDLTNQIDGKIETWFQTSDPSSSWTTDAIKAKHVGDMWFNNSTNLLKRYSSSYEWVEIHDQKAIDAYANAATAQDTADGKRRVFVATPYPPYDIGDLWVNGTDLRRCATAKASGQSYNVNDWVVAVAYDNTKTVIDGGLVTSGTIQVAGDNQSILAGMTGNGTTADAIRFWAGASFENRTTAPFRVKQDGSVVMTKADIEGKVKATSGSIGGFKISSGQIGADASYESNDGLCIINSLIRFLFNSGYIRKFAAIGDLNTFGFDNVARFELTSQDPYLIGNALFVKCESGDGSMEHWYTQRATDIRGNQFGIGKIAMFEKGYIGRAYSDIITSYFGLTHKFHFTECGVSLLSVYLPRQSEEINPKVNNAVTMFDLEIVCDQAMPNTIVLTSRDGAWLYWGNHAVVERVGHWEQHSYVYTTEMSTVAANPLSEYRMSKGDSIRLRYCNGYYYILDKRVTYQ